MATFSSSKTGIKQIIRGTASVPTAGLSLSIPLVSQTSTVVNILGVYSSTSANSYGDITLVTLAGATTLRFSAPSVAATVSYEVVEWN